jgi:uncharacterized membrane protein YkvA (DUF1232 family)
MFSRLKKVSEKLKREIKVYQEVMKDPETPFIAKALLGFIVAYALSPIDLIPDFIPILGYLDNAIIIPPIFFIALKFIPKKIIDKHKKNIRNKIF